MPVLIRRRDPHRSDCWHIHFDDITKAVGNPRLVRGLAMAVRLLSRLEARRALQRLGAVVRGGSRAAFEVAWSEYLPKSTEANFRASRVHEAWTREKYARFDCGERIPSDWRQHG